MGLWPPVPSTDGTTHGALDAGGCEDVYGARCWWFDSKPAMEHRRLILPQFWHQVFPSGLRFRAYQLHGAAVGATGPDELSWHLRRMAISWADEMRPLLRRARKIYMKEGRSTRDAVKTMKLR